MPQKKFVDPHDTMIGRQPMVDTLVDQPDICCNNCQPRDLLKHLKRETAHSGKLTGSEPLQSLFFYLFKCLKLVT